MRTAPSSARSSWSRCAASRRRPGFSRACAISPARPARSSSSFVQPDEATLATLFTQDMLDRGYLAFHQFKPSFAHQPAHVEQYIGAVDASFAMIADAIRAGDAAARLNGPVVRRGFYRLTS